MRQQLSPQYSAGQTIPVPAGNAAAFVFSNPCQHASNDWRPPSIAPDSAAGAAHTFHGQCIPPQRPAIVHAATGASVSWERLRADVLKVARSLRAIVGGEVPFDGPQSTAPIISPRTTILLCLPNCAAFACTMLGGLAALCTVTTASPLMTPTELAIILAKARPQVLVTVAGNDGEGRMHRALDLILDNSHQSGVHGTRGGPDGIFKLPRVQQWARELAADWGVGRLSKARKGELQPPSTRRRVWTVRAADDTATDYYGSGARPDGVPGQADPRDWTHLLAPPIGHKHTDRRDTLDRDAYMVPPMTKHEQRRRVALLLWSSGTTAAPKAIMLSHENIVASVLRTWANVIGFHAATVGQGETWIGLAPWTHIMGTVVILLPSIMMGATLIVPASARFSLPAYLATIVRYRATYLHVAPPVVSLLARLNANAPGLDLSSVRGMASGGAPTPIATVRAIYERHRKPVHLGYGATEAGYIAHTSAEDYASDNTRSMAELGSVGMPGANMEISIRAVEGCTTEAEIAQRRAQILAHLEASLGAAGAPVPSVQDAVPGEVCLRGPSVLLGYYSGVGSDESGQGASCIEEATTASALDGDGWYRTGDEGLLDSAGQLWIVGRLKELIKVKGYQVSPVELDATFAQHSEVQDAAAVGSVSSPEEPQERVVLYVVPRDADAVLGSQETQRALVSRLVPYIAKHAVHYKRPSVYVFCPAIPKNPTGKILRRELHTLPGTRHEVDSRGNIVVIRDAKL